MRALLLAVVSIVAFADSAVAQIENPFANVLKSPTELKVIENDDPQTVLLKKTFNAAHREMRVRYNYWLQDIGDIDGLLQSVERLHKFRLEIGPTTSEIAFVEQKLAFAKELETHCEKANSKAKYEALREINEASAKAFRIRAELARTSKAQERCQFSAQKVTELISFITTVPNETCRTRSSRYAPNN